MDKLHNIHPGEILSEEFLLPMGLTQNRLACAIGVPPRRRPRGSLNGQPAKCRPAYASRLTASGCYPRHDPERFAQATPAKDRCVAAAAVVSIMKVRR